MKTIKIVLEDGHELNLVSHNNNLWVNQKEIAILLDKGTPCISKHIKEIANGVSVNKINLPSKASDNKTYNVLFYDLELFFNVAVKVRNPDIVKKVINKIKDIDKLHPINFKFPTKEYHFKELLEKSLKGICDFIHQYKLGEYMIDFYFPNIKLAVEYDENNHRWYKNEDVRETKIKNSDLVNRIIRVEEGEELEGLNTILKYIFKMELTGITR
jgi:very-short-patch-repair endonuclease